MGNRYLSFLIQTIKRGVEELNEVDVILNDFKNDFPHVDGLNGADPTDLICSAKSAVSEAKNKLNLLNDFIVEAINE